MWSQFGLVGVALVVVTLFILVAALLDIRSAVDKSGRWLVPAVAVLFASCIWDIFFSPFDGSRLAIGVAAATWVRAMAHERQQLSRESNPELPILPSASAL
jgi:hypothetical protein